MATAAAARAMFLGILFTLLSQFTIDLVEHPSLRAVSAWDQLKRFRRLISSAAVTS